MSIIKLGKTSCYW